MLNSCLDIFEARIPSKTIGHDFGLLHALDERIAMYGWVTNTGVRLVIVVDMEGRPAGSAGAGKAAVLGLKDRDLTPVCNPHIQSLFNKSLTQIRAVRLSKRYRQHTYDCSGIRSTFQMSTTHAVPSLMRRLRSTAQTSSKKSKGSATPGIPGTLRFEPEFMPNHEGTCWLVGQSAVDEWTSTPCRPRQSLAHHTLYLRHPDAVAATQNRHTTR